MQAPRQKREYLVLRGKRGGGKLDRLSLPTHPFGHLMRNEPHVDPVFSRRELSPNRGLDAAIWKIERLPIDPGLFNPGEMEAHLRCRLLRHGEKRAYVEDAVLVSIIELV